MARKVLISFLGTGNYVPVFYSWKDKKATDHPTKFIQEAIAAKLCKGWTDKDCIMVFRTKESNERNWLDSADDKGQASIGLEATFKSMRELKCPVNPEKDSQEDTYMIPAGFSEQETEEIFKCVFDKLERDDEIYFDMTHAFRSIPLFASALFNYARFLKNVKVKGVYYGAFEALGPGYEVKNWPYDKIEANRAPIVDMTNMVFLQDLTTAASSFSHSGNLRAFSDLLADRVDEGLDVAVDDIILALEDLDLYIQTSSIEDIKAGVYLKTISSSIDDFCESPFTTDPQRKLIREIQSELSKYGFMPKEENANVEAAIKWAIDHQMIHQAYTMAKEYIISRVFDVLEKEGLIEPLAKDLKVVFKKKINAKNKAYETRNAISQILKSIFSKDNRYFMVNYMSPWYKSEFAKDLLKSHQNIGKLGTPYEDIANSRNLLAHAVTTGEGNENIQGYVDKFNRQWERCQEALRELNSIRP